jgi:hypothetical protein
MTPVRFSHLKHMGTSPAHYRASLTSTHETPAMRLGTLVHAMVLGRTGGLAVYEGTRRGKAWDEFRAANDGTLIVTASERDAAQPIADAVATDPHAAQLLTKPGLFEHRIEWMRAGRACAGTPDFFNATTIVDLKTCATADPRRWTGRFGEIRKRSYHSQLAWYADGIEAAGMPKPREAYLIAVETRAPFPVVVYRIEGSELEAGRRQYSAWWEALRVCEEANHWPGYAQHVVSVEADEDDEPTELIFGDEEESEAA